MLKPILKLGRIVAAPGAMRAAGAMGPIANMLGKHSIGIWGDLDKEDIDANDHALIHGGRILSAYWIRDAIKVWVITEADRSSTTILLPEEY